jgi:LuxR family transcriptional regulator
MKSWQEDFLHALSSASGEGEIFQELVVAAHGLGFEYCAYGIRFPLPMSNPKVLMLSAYPAGWHERYQSAGYVHHDPTVLHGRRTQAPVIWSDALFASAPELWAEARSAGVRVGWAQSSLDANGIGGMLTLARSNEGLFEKELAANELKMRWLASMSHLALSRALGAKLQQGEDTRLTEREIEVLKWSADGKTSREIAQILIISVDTVNFHVRNAITKLGASNKTSAVVRAAMSGLLN